MAQPPDTINETFLREVDENLRRDQLADFGKKYGNWIIAGLIIFLAAAGSVIFLPASITLLLVWLAARISRRQPMGRQSESP